MNVFQILDFAASAFVFGATAWFFFVQSPALLRRLGREQFVPLQMQLTVVLFRTLGFLLLAIVGLTAASNALTSPMMATAVIAAAGGWINQFVIVPRALRAGGRSRRDIKGKDHEGSVGGFASEGAGNVTKTMHRLVVVFVVVMLAGILGHGVVMLGG